MNIIAFIACLAVLLAIGYFFYCCAVTVGLWLRQRLDDKRANQQYRTMTTTR